MITAQSMPAILRGVKRILFYGDSLTDGSSYPDYVVNTLIGRWPEAGFEIQNAAICGDTARRLVHRLDTDVLDRHPDLVIIAIGTNDCGQNRPVEEYKSDLRFLVEQTHNAGAKVLLVKPSHLGDPEKERRFEAYLSAIDRMAAAFGLLVADAHAEFIAREREGRSMLGKDGIHHGEHGFEGMARAVLDALGLKDEAIDMRIRPWPDLILDNWETSAPVPADDPFSLDRARDWKPFDRQAAIGAQSWGDSPFAARGAWMPFALGKPATPSFAYGRTFCNSEHGGKAQLQVGGSPKLVVWLNGREVWRQAEVRGFHPNADRTTIELAPGRNEIAVVSNYMAFIGIAACHCRSKSSREACQR